MKSTFVCALLCLIVSPTALIAQSSTYNQVVDANTFVSSGQPNTSFGGQGAMEIAAPTTAQPNTESALLGFNTAAMQASFNTEYGSGDWVVTGITLTLFSNVAKAGQQPNNNVFNQIAAGAFELDLLSDNNWSQSSITWNTLPAILPGGSSGNTSTTLGTFNWAATGAASTIWTLGAVQPLVDDIDAGNQVTILGQATTGSTVGYLFNTLTLNPGYLNVTVQAVPEPATLSLITTGLLCVTIGSSVVRRKHLRAG